jgi:hypothetical protein
LIRRCVAVTTLRALAAKSGELDAKPLHHLRFAGMLPRIMSQGPDASKDAESIAKVVDSSSTDQRAKDSSSPAPSASAEGERGEPEEREESARDAEPRAQTSSQETSSSSPFPETEEALNVPKPQTVRMLGLMSALTLIAWFAARLACNAHPDQVREPKHFSTKDLAADAKNAAFEFHHGFETSDFVTALDLATGDARKLVEQKLQACEADPDECHSTQKKLAGSVVSTARVLEQSGDRATVELVSKYTKGLQAKTFLFEVIKEGDFYRVATRREVPNAVPANTSATANVPSATPMVGTSPDNARDPESTGEADTSGASDISSPPASTQK